MSESAPRNIAHSVHQRLLNQARESGRPFNSAVKYSGVLGTLRGHGYCQRNDLSANHRHPAVEDEDP